MPATNPTILAYAAFLVSAAAVAVNLWQFLRKRKQENNELDGLARRALAERDSIVVKGAEGALLMMEKMLTTATTEGDILRQRISTLEDEKRNLTQRVAELEKERDLERRRADDLEKRIAELERKEHEHGSHS